MSRRVKLLYSTAIYRHGLVAYTRATYQGGTRFLRFSYNFHVNPSRRLVLLRTRSAVVWPSCRTCNRRLSRINVVRFSSTLRPEARRQLSVTVTDSVSTVTIFHNVQRFKIRIRHLTDAAFSTNSRQKVAQFPVTNIHDDALDNIASRGDSIINSIPAFGSSVVKS